MDKCQYCSALLPIPRGAYCPGCRKALHYSNIFASDSRSEVASEGAIPTWVGVVGLLAICAVVGIVVTCISGSKTNKVDNNIALYNDWVRYQNDIASDWNGVTAYSQQNKHLVQKGMSKQTIDFLTRPDYESAAKRIAERSKLFKMPSGSDYDPRLVQAINDNVAAGVKLGSIGAEEAASASAVQEFSWTSSKCKQVMELIAHESGRKLK